MIDRELLEQFLLEARPQIDTAAAGLLAIEHADTPDPERTADTFRAIHTLKGGAAICGLDPLVSVLHAAEDLLDALRAHRLAPAAVIAPLLDAVAHADAWLRALDTGGTLPPDAAREAARLEADLRRPLDADPAAPPDRNLDAATPDAATLDAATLDAIAARHPDAATGATPLTAIRYTPDRDCFFRGEDPLALVRQVPGLVALDLALAPDADGSDPFRCHLVVEALTTADPATIASIFRTAADQVATAALAALPAPRLDAPRLDAPGPDTPRPDAPRTLRVAVARVDRLVDLAGELVAARNALAERAATLDPALARALRPDLAAVERLAGELHRTATACRLTPLAQCFRRLPLAVHETATALGKSVRLETTGDAVEADRTLVDALFEPLLHLLRNACDHGIEPAPARHAAGKPPTGRITLHAQADPHGLSITVTDDGGGIDPAALRRTAAARGDSAAAALTDTEALDLVWAPGFSTAAAVTGVSGRGVGMDAVRATVEALGGSTNLASTPGLGTTIRLTLPQAASLTSTIIVRTAGERFGIPITAVTEAARVARDRILPLGGGEAFILRDHTVPLRPLATLLGLAPAPRPMHATVLLLGAPDAPDRTGIEVDAVLGRADLLLRPLAGLLAAIPFLLGTAVEADGAALLVLDLPGLAAAAA